MKKILAVALVAMMVLAMATTAFAGEVKSITIKNAAVGKEYNLYKIFDASILDKDHISYKYAKEMPTNDYFTVNADGYVEFDEGLVINDGVKAVLNSIKGDPIDTKTAESNILTFKDLTDGYYYVESGLGSLVSITTFNLNAEIIDKNDTAPATDTTKDGDIDTGAKKVDKATANVGETVTYTVEFTATNFVTKDGKTKQITKYTVTDTPSGVTLSANATVQIGNNTATTVAFDDGKIELAWVNADGESTYNASEPVVITYTGVITATTGSATNKAVITYADKDLETAETGTGTVNPDEDAVKTNVATIVIDKYDSANDETKLQGAKFVLKNAEGKFYKYDASAKKVTWVSAQKDADEFETNAAGAATFAGIATGDYKLIETVSPMGYNLLANPVDVTVGAETKTVGVANTTGAVLPETGASGTNLIYVISALLVLGTAVVIISKKKASRV